VQIAPESQQYDNEQKKRNQQEARGLSREGGLALVPEAGIVLWSRGGHEANCSAVRPASDGREEAP
jgi:hypothetical protein